MHDRIMQMGIVLPLMVTIMAKAGDHHETHTHALLGSNPSVQLAQTTYHTYGALADRGAQDTEETKETVYQRKLQNLLIDSPTRPVPSWMHGPAVNDPRSYTIVVQSVPRNLWSTDTNCIANVVLSKTPDIKHELIIPSRDILDEGNLGIITPQSDDEVEGIMRYAVAGATTFLDEEQRIRVKRIMSYSNYLLLASLLATPPYLIYRDYHKGVSTGDMISDVLFNTFLNLVTAIPINYLIDGVYLAPKKREGQRMLDEVVSALPTDHEVDPTVISTVHEYARRELLKTIQTLQRQQGTWSWICCLPVWDLVARCLGTAYKDVDTAERVEHLLRASYARLQQKLDREGHMNFKEDAAQRIGAKYRDILNTIHELQPQHIETIVTRSGFSLDFTRHQRATLNKCIQNMRMNMTACVPPDIGRYMVQTAAV